MSAFARLRATFGTNWTTALIGWKGLGGLSPWPDRFCGIPPLLSVSEVATYAEERLASSSPLAREQIDKLLSLDLSTERREVVEAILQNLSKLDGADSALELRKWQWMLLEELLEKLPNDALNGLVALSEFWQSFGVTVHPTSGSAIIGQWKYPFLDKRIQNFTLPQPSRPATCV